MVTLREKAATILPVERNVRQALLFLLAAVVLAVAAGRAQADGEWLSPHYRDHPLVGTIWDARGRPVAKDAFEAALSQATYVLLGEVHTNPDHHRLQAQIVRFLAERGRRPAVVLEMVPVGMQRALDRHLRENPGDARGLGEVLRWQERGWPEWALYQPIAQAALSAGLRLVGGDLDPEVRRALGRAGPSALAPDARRSLGLEQPLAPKLERALRRRLERSHCNLLPAQAIAPMLLVQRARDGALARAMLTAEPRDGAVLIAGGGHVRRDWAVPYLIHRRSPQASVVSVAFFEVEPELTGPSAYVHAVEGLAKPFDFVYFTPRADLAERCAELAERLRKKGREGSE